jgi:glycosyltransferase involved in cell wall biosynthesis
MPDQRYRVLFVASHAVQYQSPIFRRLATHPELDIHVAYCTLKGAEAAYDPEFGAKIQWDLPLLDGYPWSEVPNRGSGKESFFGLYNPGLWRLIRTGNYDAVVCYIGYVRASFWIARLAAKLSNSAFLFGTDAVTLTPLDGRTWKRPIKRLLWPLLYRVATQVIVPSSGSRDLLLSLGLPSDRVTLTPYTVDNDWWLEQSAGVDRTAVRTYWGAKTKDLVILFSAKLQSWKRPLDLLHAFAKADPSNALLVFAGEGPLRSQLEREAAGLGLASRVRFLGFVNQSQMPSVYTASDFMVLPSAYDAFGVVVNEAMLCGCPVAVSDRVGAGRDLVAPVCGDFIFSCGDTDALAGILRRACGNPDKLAALGRLARQHLKNWSPKENIAATVAAITRAAARMGRARHKAQSEGSQGVPARPHGKLSE